MRASGHHCVAAAQGVFFGIVVSRTARQECFVCGLQPVDEVVV